MSQLSQRSIGQKIRDWTDQRCEDKYQSIAPKILREINESKSKEALELCSLLRTKLLRYIKIDELGEDILNTVTLRLCRVFDEALEKLPGNLVDHSSLTIPILTDLLKDLIEVLECFNGFILHLVALTTECANNLELLNIFEIMSNAIDIIKKSYRHCQSSAKDYGDFFKHASGLLGKVFKITYGLQKNFGSIISKLKATPELIVPEQSKMAVTNICKGLFSICEITCKLDNNPLVLTWNMMLRFMNEFKDIVNEEIDAGCYVTLISCNINECVGYCIQLHQQSSHLLDAGDIATKKAVHQSLKYSKLLMSAFIEMVRVFNVNLTEELLRLLTAFFHDFNALYELRDSEIDSGKMKSQMNIFKQLGVYETLIGVLVDDECFMRYVCVHSSQESDYGWFHVWLSIIKRLLRNRDSRLQWCQEHTGDRAAVCAIVRLTIECVSSENCASVSHFNVDVSLYDTALIHICALVSELPSDIFAAIEETLFAFLTSYSPTKSVLASDVFVFLSKSSLSMAEHYISLLRNILCSIAESNEISFPVLTLTSVLNRIAGSSKAGADALSNSSTARPIWYAFCKGAELDQSALENNVLKISQKSEVSLSDVDKLTKDTALLGNCFRNFSSSGKQKAMVKRLFLLHVDIFLNFENCKIGLWDSVNFSNFVMRILIALKFFTQYANDTDKPRVLQCLEIIVKRSSALSAKLGVIDVLAQFGSFHPKSIEAVSLIFRKLIADQNWRVRHDAADTLIKLSLRMTKSSLLESCASNPEVSQTIENHITFQCEDSTLCKGPFTKQENEYVSKFDKYVTSWTEKRCKLSENFSEKCTDFIGACNVSQRISQIKADVLALNHSCQTTDATQLSVEDLQNLSTIKSALNQLMHRFQT